MQRKILSYRPELKELARQLRKNMTAGEIQLWLYLKRKQILGYDFDRQRPIDEFIVDFYCKDLMLAIEVDGSSHDSELAQVKDEIRQRTLEALGVRFLRFSESEVLGHTDAVVLKIIDWIQRHTDKNAPLGRV